MCLTKYLSKISKLYSGITKVLTYFLVLKLLISKGGIPYLIPLHLPFRNLLVYFMVIKAILFNYKTMYYIDNYKE